jgi:peroxiredoxin
MAMQSAMLALGTPAPAFSLPDVTTGRAVSLDAFAESKAVLVMFICRHCPFVVHVQQELARLGRDYHSKGVGIVAISANDAGAYPDDRPERLKEMAAEQGFVFPFCYDASQAVAKAYQAVCTPDFFLFDSARRLVYRGQLDDSRPGRGVADGRDLRAAMDAVLAERAVDPHQRPSVGCGIKWKSGT